MKARATLRNTFAAIVTACGFAFSSAGFGAATIIIVNGDGPGEGFNDPTPAAPVGGNPGTTLGLQRLNAFQHAANIWGATLTSVEAIFVLAFFDPLPCTDTSAVLGGAGADHWFANFTGAPKANTWYPAALADKLAGTDLDPTAFDIFALFNSELGKAGCLTGRPFYLGLDNNHGPLIDLAAVLLHEVGHGLGFSVFPTTASTGVRALGLPSVWEEFMFDNTQSLTWLAMGSNAQRAASAVNFRKLGWNGANVTGNAAAVLEPGMLQLLVTGSFPAVNGVYEVSNSSVGPPLTVAGVTDDIMPVVDQPDGKTGLACTALSPLNALAVNGNIAMIDRGICAIVDKIKNAQNAGARAVIIVNDVAGSAPAFGGSDPTITIPMVSLSLADGAKLKEALAFRSRTRSGVIGTLNLDATRLAGTDTAGRVLLYTPNPFVGGSSVSHWDTSALSNLLMEPFLSPDLTHNVVPPFDLTFPLLRDLGW